MTPERSDKKRGALRTAAVCIAAALAIAAAVFGFRYLEISKAQDEAKQVSDSMKLMIPGLGVESDIQSGDGRDPLPVMTVDGIDVVGYLEVPEADIAAPVTASGRGKAGFAEYVGGSAVEGGLMLEGSRKDVFRELSKVKPGDKAAFTDIDGVRYSYSVLTQLHLKKWDEADYDLMLCYWTDDETRFVVGLKRI